MTRSAPESRAAFAHFLPVTTRWMDNDVFAHVNNVVYYSYFDTAVTHFLIESGVLDIEKSPVVGLVVNTHCNYFSSIAFPDRISVGLRLAKLGSSSVRYDIAIFRNDEDLASAQGQFVHVYVDRETNRPVPVPDSLVRALKKLAPPAAAA